MRQPRSRRPMPKQSRPRSWRSDGGQASSARGPMPRSNPRARPSSRPWRTALAKCSWPTETSPLPAVPEVLQVRQDDVAQHGLDAERREQAVDDGLSLDVVEALERLPELGAGGGQRVVGLGRRRADGGAQGHPGGDGRGVPLGEVPLHGAHARLVARAVEPEPALGALRGEQPVAALPHPEQVGGDPETAAELADPQARRAGGCRLRGRRRLGVRFRRAGISTACPGYPPAHTMRGDPSMNLDRTLTACPGRAAMRS